MWARGFTLLGKLRLAVKFHSLRVDADKEKVHDQLCYLYQATTKGLTPGRGEIHPWVGCDQLTLPGNTFSSDPVVVEI